LSFSKAVGCIAMDLMTFCILDLLMLKVCVCVAITASTILQETFCNTLALPNKSVHKATATSLGKAIAVLSTHQQDACLFDSFLVFPNFFKLHFELK
jgi:hypothetical protein